MSVHPKAAYGGLSAAVSLILLWAISYAVKVPPEVAAAFTAVVSFAGAWLAPWLPKQPA